MTKIYLMGKKKVFFCIGYQKKYYFCKRIGKYNK